jgi:tripeptidyl-peptidase-1
VTYNNFLDAIDGSYCTYDGGDSPTWDATYPDTNSFWAAAYTDPAMCGTYNATHVISGSYGSTEQDRPESYYVRECNEYMKLGLMGVSVIFASGDWGVAGVGSQCPQPDGSYSPPIGPSHNGSFNPSKIYSR